MGAGVCGERERWRGRGEWERWRGGAGAGRAQIDGRVAIA